MSNVKKELVEIAAFLGEHPSQYENDLEVASNLVVAGLMKIDELLDVIVRAKSIEARLLSSDQAALILSDGGDGADARQFKSSSIGVSIARTIRSSGGDDGESAS